MAASWQTDAKISYIGFPEVKPVMMTFRMDVLALHHYMSVRLINLTFVLKVRLIFCQS